MDTPPIILFYHGVTDTPVGQTLRNRDGKHIFKDLFASQIRGLKRSRRHIIPLSELVARLKAGESCNNAVAITFDDGYENNALCAAPVLADLKAPATFFLTTGIVGTTGIMWTDSLEDIVDRTGEPSVRVPGDGALLPLRTLDEKSSALKALKQTIKKMPSAQCWSAVHEVAAALKVDDFTVARGDHRFMSWHQAAALLEGGFDVGAHTVNHVILSRLPHADAQIEILASRDTIVKKLGRCSSTFCFPNGHVTDYTPELVEFCKQHFSAALTTKRGAARADQLFELARIGTHGGSLNSSMEWMLLSQSRPQPKLRLGLRSPG